jgi:lipopolysaccharide exporter
VADGERRLEHLAVRGTAVLVTRTVGLQVVTAAATIALARLLTPDDYGVFAIAISAQYLGRNLVDVGLPAAFVRRDEPPTVAEERALTGFMIAVGVSLSAASLVFAYSVIPAAGLSGAFAQVTAIAFLSLPVLAFRSVPALLLERRLLFGRLAAVEVVETLSFYAFALPAALTGLGAYSLAGAVPVSAIAGTACAMFLQRWSVGINLRFRLLRPSLGFGAQASALWQLHMLRELGFVVIPVASGGRAVAGYYGLSLRFFSLATAVLYAVQRVAFAALARGDAGPERVRQAGRAVGVTSVAIGLPFAITVGAAGPFVHVFLGQKWEPAINVVIASSLGVFVMTSAGGILQSLALAEGRPHLPIAAALLQTAVTLVCVPFLFAVMGVWGVGVATSLGFVVFVAVLVTRGSPGSHRRAAPMLRALVVAATAAALGIAAGTSDSLRGLCLAVIVAGTAWLLFSLLFTRAELLQLVSLIRRHALPQRR